MNTIKRITLTLVIIGAINWGLIGFFQFDLVAALFGGQDAALSRVVYALVGLSGLYCIKMLFDPMTEAEEDKDRNVQTGKMSYGTELGDEDEFVKETDLDKKV